MTEPKFQLCADVELDQLATDIAFSTNSDEDKLNLLLRVDAIMSDRAFTQTLVNRLQAALDEDDPFSVEVEERDEDGDMLLTMPEEYKRLVAQAFDEMLNSAFTRLGPPKK